jgi:hypothetical protein
MRERRNTYKVLSKSLQKGDCFEGLGIDGSIN